MVTGPYKSSECLTFDGMMCVLNLLTFIYKLHTNLHLISPKLYVHILNKHHIKMLRGPFLVVVGLSSGAQAPGHKYL